METFFKETRGSVVNPTFRELRNLDLAKVQTISWIRFKVEVQDGDVIRVDKGNKTFNSLMMEVFQGRNLDEGINKMFAHMRTQIENPALAYSRLVFNQVQF